MAQRDLYQGELPELLNALSHDLRNPLAAIITNLEFARRIVPQEGNEDLWEAITDSVAASDVLRRIVSNLDIISRVGAMTTTIHEVQVIATVQEVVRNFHGRADQAGVAIDATALAGDHRALLDRGLYALCFENLLSNSIQHAPRGSTVVIGAGVVDGHIHITLTDDGEPVPEELRELATSAKGQTPRGRTPKTRYGRGLSLLAASRAARATGAAVVLGQLGRRNSTVLRVACLP